ncbi:hypothetical protein X975_23519, partial [Stegodyphus mimosarum]
TYQSVPFLPNRPHLEEAQVLFRLRSLNLTCHLWGILK